MIQKITMPESIRCTQLKLQIDKNIEIDHVDKNQYLFYISKSIVIICTCHAEELHHTNRGTLGMLPKHPERRTTVQKRKTGRVLRWK